MLLWESVGLLSITLLFSILWLLLLVVVTGCCCWLLLLVVVMKMSGAEEIHPSPIRVSGSELIRQLSLRKVERKKNDTDLLTPTGSVRRKHSVSERKLSVSERGQPRGRLVRQSTTAASTTSEGRASQRRRQLREERHWHSCEVDPASLDIAVIHLSEPEVSAVTPSRKPSVAANSVHRSGSQKSTHSGRPGSARYAKTPLDSSDHVVLILDANEAKEPAASTEGPRHRARVVVILTTLFLLLTCLLLVGITLRLAPLIDEIGESICLSINR